MQLHSIETQFGNRRMFVHLPDYKEEAEKSTPTIFVKSFPINQRGYSFLTNGDKKASKSELIKEIAYQYERYQAAFHDLSVKMIKLKRRYVLANVVAAISIMFVILMLKSIVMQ